MVTPAPPARLDWLLDDLVRRIPGVRHTIVLSADGLLLARSDGIEAADAEHLAAMGSALHGLARSAGERFAAGPIRQTVVELADAILFVCAAGDNACLALLADDTAAMSIVAYEMNQTVQKVGAALSSPARHSLDERTGPPQ